MSNTVLLTGISGFLGLYLAHGLLQAGYAVRGSVRDIQKIASVRNSLALTGADVFQLSFVSLDLLSDDNWTEAARDCRYLLHSASPFVLRMPKDKSDLVRPAVEGTRRAIKAGLAAGVDRIVLTSSMSAIAHGHGAAHTGPYTAADWTKVDGPHVNAYALSKTLAERCAWEMMFAAGSGHKLATINPCTVLGPLLSDDPGTSPLVLMRLLRGGMPALARLAIAFTDVRDVVAVHVAALSSPLAGGQRIPIGGKSLYLSDLAEILRRKFPQFSQNIPRTVLPDWLVRIYSLIDPELRANLDMLGVRTDLESSLAERLLGRRLGSDEEAIVATCESLIQRRLI